MIGCDAIVVGGGPAGSSCARDLAAAGCRVLVVDRARFPRDKCCAGWITPHVVRALDLDLAVYAQGRTLQSIGAFTTGAVGYGSVTTSFDRTISYAIRRCEFDDYLLTRSRALLATGLSAEPVRRVRDRWVVADRYEAPMLVGAGGHHCPVAHTLNPGRDPGVIVVAQECECRMTPNQAASCAVRGDTPELYFCPDRQGYGWCVRKGDYLNIGFGRLGGAALRRRVEEFLAVLVSQRRVPASLAITWLGHAYRIYLQPMRNMVDAGVVLVGDAAGLADPTSGEGILTAVESGRLAARAILDAGGRYDRERLDAYPAALARRYGRPRPGQGAMGDTWSRSSRLASWIGVRLLSMPWFARHVLLGRWFLHHQLPPLSV